MAIVCEYCNSILNNKSSLNNHQKTAKKCLSKQKDLGIETKEIIYECKYCSKSFILKMAFTSHLNKCEKKELKTIYETEISKLKDKIVELEKIILVLENEKKISLKTNRKLEKELKDLKTNVDNKTAGIVNSLLKKTGNKNTNTTNISYYDKLIRVSMDDLITNERINEQVNERFSIEYMAGNIQESLADFYIDYIARDEVGKLHIMSKRGGKSVFYKVTKDEIVQINEDLAGAALILKLKACGFIVEINRKIGDIIKDMPLEEQLKYK